MWPLVAHQCEWKVIHQFTSVTKCPWNKKQRENKGKSSDKKRIPTANPPAFQKSDTNKKIDEIAIWNLQAVFLNRIADHAKRAD